MSNILNISGAQNGVSTANLEMGSFDRYIMPESILLAIIYGGF